MIKSASSSRYPSVDPAVGRHWVLNPYHKYWFSPLDVRTIMLCFICQRDFHSSFILNKKKDNRTFTKKREKDIINLGRANRQCETSLMAFEICTHEIRFIYIHILYITYCSFDDYYTSLEVTHNLSNFLIWNWAKQI